MNGDDVAVVRRDIAHLGERLGEWRDETKGCRAERREVEAAHSERIREIEQGIAGREGAWEGHLKEHRGISQQLGLLRTDSREIKAGVKKNGASNRDVAVKGGVAGAGGTAVILITLEIVQRVLEVVLR